MGYEGCGGPDKVHIRQHKNHSRHCEPSAEAHVEHVRPHKWCQPLLQRARDTCAILIDWWVIR